MELNEAQIDTLKQFQEITNIQDPEIAIGTLASLDWNLERALETHLLDEGGPDEHDFGPDIDFPPRRPTIEEQRPSVPFDRTSNNIVDRMEITESDDLDSSVQYDENEEHVNVRTPRKHGSGQQPSSSRRSHPEYDYEDGYDEYESTTYTDPAPSSGGRSNGDIPLIPEDIHSIKDALTNFISVFESRYCSQAGAFMPCFHVGALDQATRDAFEAPNKSISERKPLAIYIHNDKSVAANIFASKVMCDDQVSSLLRHQFVLWAWDVTFKQNQVNLIDWLKRIILPDARHVYEMMQYERDRYPLLILLTKEKGTYKIVEICDGRDSSEQVVQKLLVCVNDYTKIRMNEMQEQREREERERIRQEQAEEYEKSLAQDLARREAKDKEIREQKQEEERRVRAEQEEKLRRAQLERELPDEPVEGASDAIMVKFRVPEGEQFMRRFHTSDKLSDLLKFLSSKGFNKEQYRFFNSDVPKKDICTTWDANSTFTSLKWPRREQIFVEEQ